MKHFASQYLKKNLYTVKLINAFNADTPISDRWSAIGDQRWESHTNEELHELTTRSLAQKSICDNPIYRIWQLANSEKGEMLDKILRLQLFSCGLICADLSRLSSLWPPIRIRILIYCRHFSCSPPFSCWLLSFTFRLVSHVSTASLYPVLCWIWSALLIISLIITFSFVATPKRKKKSINLICT